MGTLFNLPMRWRKGGQTTFSKSELGQLMSLYGERVSKGEWRDYALDSLSDVAIFSVFKSAHERPIYTITKKQGRGLRQSTMFVVYNGEKPLKQSASLFDVLQVLRDIKK